MSKINSAIAGAGAGAAVGGPWGAAIGGVAGLFGGSDDESGSTLERMLAETKNMPLPVLKEYYPELYKIVAQMNPEMESAVNLGPSEMAGISTDPSLRIAQKAALAKLQGIGDAGGRDSQFLADQARLESDVNTNLQGQEGAIMQNMAARGMSGGGSELAARMQSAQGASNRQAQMGMDAKAQADKRALDAIMQSGDLAGKMQGQDFSQAAQKAQAADAISRFNAANQQQVMSNNVGAKNTAQASNVANQNMVAGQNTAASNQAQQQNLSLAQQQYENELRKRGLINTASTAYATNQQSTAQAQDKFIGGLAGVAGKYAATQKPGV